MSGTWPGHGTSKPGRNPGRTHRGQPRPAPLRSLGRSALLGGRTTLRAESAGRVAWIRSALISWPSQWPTAQPVVPCCLWPGAAWPYCWPVLVVAAMASRPPSDARVRTRGSIRTMAPATRRLGPVPKPRAVPATAARNRASRRGANAASAVRHRPQNARAALIARPARSVNLASASRSPISAPRMPTATPASAVRPGPVSPAVSRTRSARTRSVWRRRTAPVTASVGSVNAAPMTAVSGAVSRLSTVRVGGACRAVRRRSALPAAPAARSPTLAAPRSAVVAPVAGPPQSARVTTLAWPVRGATLAPAGDVASAAARAWPTARPATMATRVSPERAVRTARVGAALRSLMARVAPTASARLAPVRRKQGASNPRAVRRALCRRRSHGDISVYGRRRSGALPKL
jgi:hypothetical protein